MSENGGLRLVHLVQARHLYYAGNTDYMIYILFIICTPNYNYKGHFFFGLYHNFFRYAAIFVGFFSDCASSTV